MKEQEAENQNRPQFSDFDPPYCMKRMNRSRTVTENVARWRDLVARRIRARDERRKPFDRERFLAEFEADHPFYRGAVELADTFDRAAAEAHGSPDRFKKELDRRLGEFDPWPA